MILDSINQSYKYEKIHPSFKNVFQFLKDNDISQLANGKYEVEGTVLNITEAKGAHLDKALLEIHKDYIDIHIPLTKTETIGYNDGTKMDMPVDEYSSSDDIQFFKDKPSAFIDVTVGQFAIVFPFEGHMPCLFEGTARKIIVKIKSL